MKGTIAARDLQPGDSIRIKGGTVYFHRLPIDRSKPFVAHYAWRGSTAGNGEVTYEPDEQVEVISRWPVGHGIEGV